MRQITSGRMSLATKRTTAFLAAFVIIGCSERSNVGPNPELENPYWSLELNHRAINLSTTSPWDTVRLSVIPRSRDGGAISADSAVLRYISSDSNTVGVSSDGKVRAKKTGQRIRIIAALTIGQLTKADTAYVSVFARTSPPQLAQFSIEPPPPDSAKTGDEITLSSKTRMLDANGNPMTNFLVSYRADRPMIARIALPSGTLTPGIPGTVTIIGSIFAFGVAMADTAVYTIGYPTFGIATFTEGSENPLVNVPVKIDEGNTIAIGVGGAVYFTNLFDPSVANPRIIDLVFDDPTYVEIAEGGDMFPDETVNVQIPGLRTAARRFTRAGTYTFRDRNSTVVGTVRVIDDRIPSS